MTTPLRAIAANLIEEEAGVVYLVGGRRKSDGKVVFPLPSDAEAAHFDRIRLSPEGRLWSFPLQRFRPKSPPYAGRESEAGFKSYAVGYVELPGQVERLSWLATWLVRLPGSGDNQWRMAPC